MLISLARTHYALAPLSAEKKQQQQQEKEIRRGRRNESRFLSPALPLLCLRKYSRIFCQSVDCDCAATATAALSCFCFWGYLRAAFAFAFAFLDICFCFGLVAFILFIFFFVYSIYCLDAADVDVKLIRCFGQRFSPN